MNEKINQHKDKEINNKLKKESEQFLTNTIKNFNGYIKRFQQLIIEHIKENVRPIEDKDFLFVCNDMKKCYITFDFDKGEVIYLSLVDSNDTYDVGFLVEALFRELMRLWKFERKNLNNIKEGV